MLAIEQHAYGGPERLEINEARPVPQPGRGEVLVRVGAASVNEGDRHLLLGSPRLVRLMFGLRRPSRVVPGQYVAGTVEAVGEEAPKAKGGKKEREGANGRGVSVGQRVVGFVPGGGFAEFVCASAANFVPLPEAVGLAAGASALHGGLSALQALRDAAKVQPGQRVLVLGAAGAVGSLSVQLAARHFQAEVTGVCSAAHADRVRALGATRTVDYAADGLVNQLAADAFDVVLDTVGHRYNNRELRRLVKPGGVGVLVSLGDGGWFGGVGRAVGASAGNAFTSHKLAPFMAEPNAEDVATLVRLLEEGKLQVEPDRTFPLRDTRAAFERLIARRERRLPREEATAAAGRFLAVVVE